MLLQVEAAADASLGSQQISPTSIMSSLPVAILRSSPLLDALYLKLF